MTQVWGAQYHGAGSGSRITFRLDEQPAAAMACDGRPSIPWPDDGADGSYDDVDEATTAVVERVQGARRRLEGDAPPSAGCFGFNAAPVRACLLVTSAHSRLSA